jgi:hypothetical protein
VDRVDHLGVVDSSQVRGGDPEVGMPELALYDQERDPSRDISEWRLLMATHNLTKLHRHQLTGAGA